MTERLDANATGDYVTYTLPNVPAGTYTLIFRTKTGSTRGKFQLSIDGINRGAVQDPYSTAYAYYEVNLGTKTFSSTANRNLKFTVTGKNASSTGYNVVADYIKLTP